MRSTSLFVRSSEQDREVFRDGDTDQDGALSYRELEAICGNEDARVLLHGLGVNLDDVQWLFTNLDIDESGTLSIDESPPAAHLHLLLRQGRSSW